MSEIERNQELAEAICRDLRWNGKELKEGQCVALLDGAIVAIAPMAGLTFLRQFNRWGAERGADEKWWFFLAYDEEA